MWSRLRSRFKQVFACVLMPDHLHLVVKAVSAEWLKEVMRIELGAFTRKLYPGTRLWQPTSPPAELPNSLHLKRTIRYVHLNPCREVLARDPLEWEWSTHRDAVGAAAPAWIDLSAYQSIWGNKHLAETVHAYISSDPSVRIQGTSLPAAPKIDCMAATLPSIERAVLQATRAPAGSRLFCTPARRQMLLLARQLGASQQSMAKWTEVSERSVRNALAAPVTVAEQAILRSSLLVLSAPSRFEPTALPRTGSL